MTTRTHSQATLSKLSLMSNYQLGLIACALGRHRYVPDEFWLAMFVSETAPKLASMQPRQLSNTLWAVAQWGVDPGGCRWLLLLLLLQ